MILKLQSGSVTEMIECGQVRCEHRRFGSHGEAKKWERTIGIYSAFGPGIDELQGRDMDLDGYHLSIARYKAAHGNENWEHIVCWECGVFLMNENGKTVEIFSR